jgi:hypothetical protein
MIKLAYQQKAKKGIWCKTFERFWNKCTSYKQVKADYRRGPQTVRRELNEPIKIASAIITQSRHNKKLNMLHSGMGGEDSSWYDVTDTTELELWEGRAMSWPVCMKYPSLLLIGSANQQEAEEERGSCLHKISCF